MTVTRTAESCNSKPSGETLLANYTITGTKLELLIDNVSYVATRL